MIQHFILERLKRKAETEMGGLREEIFVESGRGEENESEGFGNGEGWWTQQ